MAIYLSEKFKQFRKARDLTQEQIADTFNVSPQTVSRWETGTNFPDIGMLPSIAEFFKVTVDDLLGVDIVQKKAKAKKFWTAIHEKFRERSLDEAIIIGRKAVAEIPNDYNLLSWLALVLWEKHYEAPKEEQEKYIREVISINERILEECPYEPGDCTRANAYQRLAYAYNEIGDKEKALKFANGLTYYDSQVMRCRILEKEEKLKQAILNIEIFANLIMGHIDFLEEFEKAEEIQVELNDEAINGGFLIQNTITVYNEIIVKLKKYAKTITGDFS
jgi:transcriptional regulator with XRE-family HTH domain